MLSGNVNQSDSRIKIIKGVQATSNQTGFYVSHTKSNGDSYTGPRNLMQLKDAETMVVYTIRRPHLEDFTEYLCGYHCQTAHHNIKILL